MNEKLLLKWLEQREQVIESLIKEAEERNESTAYYAGNINCIRELKIELNNNTFNS